MFELVKNKAEIKKNTIKILFLWEKMLIIKHEKSKKKQYL